MSDQDQAVSRRAQVQFTWATCSRQFVSIMFLIKPRLERISRRYVPGLSHFCLSIVIRKFSLIKEGAAVKDSLLDSAVRHSPLAISVQLVLLEISFLDSAIGKRTLTVALQLVVLERAFFNKAVGVNTCRVAMHLTIAVLALNEACIRQVNADAVQFLLLVHLS